MADKLTLLKLEISPPITTSAYDSILESKLTLAEQEIRREGIILTGTVEDDQLVIMYAAFLWRSRKESSAVMPRALRFALNNRLFSQKAGGVDALGCL